MPFGGDEISMGGFVRDIKKEWLLALPVFQPIETEFGQFIRDIAALGFALLAIDVESIATCLWDKTSFDRGLVRVSPINTLALETHPMVKTTLRVIIVSAHVPFPDECRLVSIIPEKLGEKGQIFPHRIVIVDDSMIMSV